MSPKTAKKQKKNDLGVVKNCNAKHGVIFALVSFGGQNLVISY